MAGLSTTLIMVTNLHTSYTKQLYISRVRFLDLPPKPSSKNLPLSERLSVETREWTAQAKAEVAYQLGNVNVKSIDPLLQLGQLGILVVVVLNINECECLQKHQ